MGRGSSKIGGGGGGSATNKTNFAKLIAQTPFTDNGGGQWTLDIDGIGGALSWMKQGQSRH